MSVFLLRLLLLLVKRMQMRLAAQYFVMWLLGWLGGRRCWLGPGTRRKLRLFRGQQRCWQLLKMR